MTEERRRCQNESVSQEEAEEVHKKNDSTKTSQRSTAQRMHDIQTSSYTTYRTFHCHES